MSQHTGIRWGLVVLSAGLAEAIMLGLAIVFRQQQYGEQAVTVMALIGSFVLPLLFAIWVGSRVQARVVLHGVLIGAVGVLIYELLIVVASLVGPRPQIPFLYYVAHGLKLVGGALGGMIATRRTHRTASGATV